MQKKWFLITLGVVTLLCGCDKQTKINSEKIQLLSQNILQFEQGQSRQMALIQTQLVSLAPMFDRIHNSYFEKNHDYEFLYHTNTLYLLLTMGKKIEAHLQEADTQRESANLQAYLFHTNEMDLLQVYTAQLLDAMASQEGRIEKVINAETRETSTNLTAELTSQIKLASVPDARWEKMEADVAQIKRDLAQIKEQLALLTNLPALRR